MSLPDYNFLAAPLWLVTTLHVITLTLHFATMNFMVGSIIIILFGRFEDKWNHPVVRKLLKLFPAAMAATVTLGVAPLLFVQLTYYQQVYSAAIVSGWFWLIIIVAAMIGYYLLYAGSFSRSGDSRPGVWLTLALICFAYISFVYTSVFSLAERPELTRALYVSSQSGVVVNSDVGHYLFRWLHMILGAMTVGAFFVGVLGRDDEQTYRTARGYFLYGMVATMIFGLVYMFTMGEYILPLMRSAAIWILTLAVILSLGALHFFFKKKFILSGLMLFISLPAMVLSRHLVRQLYLEQHFDPADLAVRTQWSILIVFLICFVIAVGAVWYMLRLYGAGEKGAHTA
ncbi:MAG: hypothetical protein OEW00_06580 [candidate division Zixibacteria bacterium]|nr:hypothetical protein [candidate division Zixibacteria bacterium]